MPEKDSEFEDIPEDIRNALVQLAADFINETGVSFDEVRDFMAEVIRLHGEYLRRKENVH